MRSLPRIALFFVLAAILLLVAGPARANSSNVDCVNGYADIYPCSNVNMLGQLTLAEMDITDPDLKGNDHWGWTDPDTGKNYVIFGVSDRTTFIDVSDPAAPVYLGMLMGADGASQWRDIKVYQNHAFITADIPTQSGIQVFDLTKLRDVANPPVAFTADALYDGFGPGHNLWINEETGYLYAFRTDTCDAAIHVVDIQNPLTPSFASCVATDDAPLSDSECVIYDGPDAAYVGREVCFTGSDNDMGIDDVTDKQNPIVVARFGYPTIQRAHQGALTADHRYWILSDTMDEQNLGINTRTYAFDVTDLDNPQYLGYYEHDNTSRDHNLYVVGNLAYETNWTAGLHILDISNLPGTDFTEVGYFDVLPETNSIAQEGSWSNYPWWDDFVSVSTTSGGLYLLQYVPEAATSVGLSQFAGSSNNMLWLPLALLGGLSLAALTWRRRQREV